MTATVIAPGAAEAQLSYRAGLSGLEFRRASCLTSQFVRDSFGAHHIIPGDLRTCF